MKKLLMAIAAIFILNNIPAFGQEIEIRGHVIESGTSNYMYDVSVIAISYSNPNTVINGTKTDENGTFYMKISKQEYKLKVLYVGFKPVILPDVSVGETCFNDNLTRDIFLERGDIATAVSWAEYNMYRAICEQFDFENDNFETF